MWTIRTGALLGIGLHLLCVSQGAAQQTPVFVVYGEVFLSDAITPSTRADTVAVVNRATGVAVVTTVGALEPGTYGAVFVDPAGNRAAAVGDTLVISLIADTGGLLFTLSHTVSAGEVAEFGLHQPLVRFDGSSSVVFGWVKDESGQPLEGVTVEVTDVLQQRVVATAVTIETGFYATGGLIIGGYRVEAIPPPGSYFLGEYHHDIPSFDPANVTRAQTIWLVPHAVFGADFTLSEGGVFAGTVTDSQDGTPLTARVSPILFPNGHVLRATRSGTDGAYISVALPPGTYGAAIHDVGGYLDEYYLEASSLAEADPFEVALTAVTPSIDFTLGRDPVGTGGTESPPAAFALGEPRPNPFSSSMSVAYVLPARVPVRLAVHDVRGRLVRVLVDGTATRGGGQVTWDGHDGCGSRLPAGVYLLTLEGAGHSASRTAVLLP